MKKTFSHVICHSFCFHFIQIKKCVPTSLEFRSYKYLPLLLWKCNVLAITFWLQFTFVVIRKRQGCLHCCSLNVLFCAFIIKCWQEIFEVCFGANTQVGTRDSSERLVVMKAEWRWQEKANRQKQELMEGEWDIQLHLFSLIIPLRFTSHFVLREAAEQWLCTPSLFYNRTCASLLRGIFKEQGLLPSNYHQTLGTKPFLS